MLLILMTKKTQLLTKFLSKNNVYNSKDSKLNIHLSLSIKKILLENKVNLISKARLMIKITNLFINLKKSKLISLNLLYQRKILLSFLSTSKWKKKD